MIFIKKDSDLLYILYLACCYVALVSSASDRSSAKHSTICQKCQNQITLKLLYLESILVVV